MGLLRTRLGIGKSAMGFGLGAFHLFLSISFFQQADGDPFTMGTGFLLVGVAAGMVFWGYRHRNTE